MGIAEIPNWLKGLPLAPEFRPTDTEFADPIAYISKIEKEASAFGICKVIPPLPKPSKKYVLTNLNKSLAKCPELGSDLNALKVSSDVGSGGGNDGENRAVFTTRHQELGQSGKKAKGPGGGPLLGVHKQVWQSGEVYTLEQFESKSKVFAKSLLGGVKEVSPLVVEAMFWKASSDKPICIEYANDVPGSGFGEPESPVKYFHRRRRKRMHYQRSRESYDCKGNHMDGVMNSCDNVMEDVPASKDSDTLLEAETPKLSIAPSNLSTDETPSSSRRKRSNSRNEMEGTAGWKLSNSPWNLQVIARSPGSLTRFMPDDIPGVTSPMVYIGMLFSWFAWHVEDHELHSMNFLHTGSAKTWYAVPGDCAFAFEEVIRNEAYGGNIDHLAALALLGEKTTLLSPEVVVASGIPCCRLIQNPGEFVVTFPRAYHIGFSHGFNCGEAANFGTPQWLSVAKEAAVRRAAMSYLPMLSHRQLLYLLTMSFVCRVPRSLLPGARSSRLRDRQKEEREVLVKKAFIEDMLNENNLLNVLLSKKSTYQAVLWDPDLLPSSNQESLLSIVTTTTTPPPRESIPHIHSENNCTPNNAFDESLYMGTLEDLYLDDYDLSCDFQVDTGTLACVACGILGFPFMSVVQPSALSSDQILIQGSGTMKSPSIHSSPNLDCAAKGTVSENISQDTLSPKCPAMPSIAKYKEEWNTSSGFVRPRIFCLDHAVQIEETLRFKGGAKVLVICHTDYQKIKAHAASIAEEIGLPFNYIEIPLDKASQEDLNLIDLAIDDEEHMECGEDWTSKLGINLRHCIKVSKNSPSKQVQHALALDGLFTEKCSSSEFVNMKWQSQRSRSKLKLNRPVRHKLCEGFQMKKDELLGGISDAINVKIEQKVIQYKRRKFKSKPGDLAGTSRGCDWPPPKPLPQEVCAVTCQYLDKLGGNSSENHFYNVQIGTTSSRLCCSASTKTPQLQDERVLEATMENSSDTDPTHISLPLLTASVVVGNVEAHVENQILEGMDVESRAQDGSEMENKIQVSEQVGPENEISCATKYASSHASARPTDSEFEKQEDNEFSKQVNIVKVTCKMAIGNHPEGQHNAEAAGDVFIDEVVSDITNPAGSDVKSTVIGGVDGQMETTVVANSCTQSEVSFSSEGQQELHISTKSDLVETVSTNVALMIQPTASVEKVSEVCSETFTSCDGLPSEQGTKQEMKTTNRSNEETILNDVERMNQPLDVMEDESDFPRDSCATDDLSNCQMLDDEVQQEIFRNGSCEKEIVLDLVKQTEVDQSTPASVEDSSGLPAEAGPEEILCSDMAQNREIQHRIQITNISKEEPVSSYDATLTEQPASVPVKECSDVQRESYAAMNLHDCHEGSSHENREQECTKPTLVYLKSTVAKGRKRREVEHNIEDNCDGFIRGPCEGLRPRGGRDGTNKYGNDNNRTVPNNDTKAADVLVSDKGKQKRSKESHRCDVEGCRMSFRTNYRCPLDGCRKRFRSHKYAVLHQRVHDDERPLKCPWEGCSMSFKWAWARTEHIRLHTGERPYECKVEGCGRSFRFVSDYSRHRRKMGHYVTSPT